MNTDNGGEEWNETALKGPPYEGERDEDESVIGRRR